jgi:ABC-type dipeptide/oligopeptide/nickel transport system ATPase component
VSFKYETAGRNTLDDINIVIEPKTTIGIVGESGSGKSVTALAIMQLLPPQANIVSGNISFNNVNLLKLRKQELQKFRGNKISMIIRFRMNTKNNTKVAEIG